MTVGQGLVFGSLLLLASSLYAVFLYAVDLAVRRRPPLIALVVLPALLSAFLFAVLPTGDQRGGFGGYLLSAIVLLIMCAAWIVYRVGKLPRSHWLRDGTPSQRPIYGESRDRHLDTAFTVILWTYLAAALVLMLSGEIVRRVPSFAEVFATVAPFVVGVALFGGIAVLTVARNDFRRRTAPQSGEPVPHPLGVRSLRRPTYARNRDRYLDAAFTVLRWAYAAAFVTFVVGVLPRPVAGLLGFAGIFGGIGLVIRARNELRRWGRSNHLRSPVHQ